MDYIKNLAGDLLTLEVNTIVKENTTSSKMPATRRYALQSIANSYRDLLCRYGMCRLNDDEESSAAVKKLPRLQWRFGGMYSFMEIARVCSRNIDILSEELKTAAPDEKSEMDRQLRMLQRMARHSSNFIGMFKARQKERDEWEENPSEISPNPETGLFPSQVGSAAWNNDIGTADINRVPDIDLEPDELTLLRKTWEIGTQQVLLQTVVQIDGDIANYLSTSFIHLPPEIRTIVLGMHRDSTESATRLWQTLFRTVAQLAGKAFNQIFNRNSSGAGNNPST